MKAFVLLIFLFVLKIAISQYQPYSAFSCALGRTVLPLLNQQVAANVLNTTDSQESKVFQTHVFFYLHTKENLQGQQIILNDKEALQLTHFDAKRDTKIITHGYLASKDTSSCTRIRDAFLSTGDYNVIVVDWSPMQFFWGFFPMDYWTVAGYVPGIGKYVAQLIDFLESYGMDMKTMTLVGHSLGAHIMGIASYQSRNAINYIVGLDPAMPVFESRNDSERLSVDDATVVEVIHTDQGNCGMASPMGHFDFYPNGGSKQPGCKNNKCSHSRSSELYAESLQNVNAFCAFKCLDFESVKRGECFGDLALMGGALKSPSKNEGMYYLQTRDSYPFGLGI